MGDFPQDQNEEELFNQVLVGSLVNISDHFSFYFIFRSSLSGFSRVYIINGLDVGVEVSADRIRVVMLQMMRGGAPQLAATATSLGTGWGWILLVETGQ